MEEDSIQESSSRGCEAEPGDDDAVEVSLENFAFSIDDIFEQILGSVDKVSLFSCRYVSRRWWAVATKVLKRKDICMFISVLKDLAVVFPMYHRVYYKGLRNPVPLSKLISFTNETYTQVGSFALDAFLCTRLQVTGCPLDYQDLQSLLDAYGEHLRDLHVCPRLIEASQCETSFIKQVEHLLCVQAPHLEKLSFRNLEFKSATSAPASTTGLPSKTASESNTVEFKKTNLKLRRLSLKSASRKVIDSIVALCPNLNQIDVDSSDFHVLTQPTNLLHFVREFDFRCPSLDLRNIQLVEAASLMSPEERTTQNVPPIKCTKLTIDFWAATEHMNGWEDVRFSLVQIINKILESSWDTLELIYFSYHTNNTLRGLKWPRVLPKLERLYSKPDGYGSCGLEIFPLDGTFKIQDTFPRVKNFKLYVTHENIKHSNAVDFLKKRSLGPVTSVTNVGVTVLFNLERDGEEEVVDEEQQLCFYSENLLSALFPSVAVSLERDYIEI